MKALARVFRYQKLLDDGRYASISEMAEAEKIERGYLGSLLRLTLLSPNIVEAILEGRLPADRGLSALMQPFSSEWMVCDRTSSRGPACLTSSAVRSQPSTLRASW